MAVDAGELQGVAGAGGNLSQGRGAGEAVGHGLAIAESRAGSHENLVAAHPGGIGEEEERAGYEGHVDNVVAGAAEHLLGKHDGKSRGHGHHPQRRLDGANHRDEDACHEEALLDFLLAPLREGKFNAEAYEVGDHDARQDGQETVEHELPEGELRGAQGQPVLVAGVVHAEQKARD